MTRLYLPPSGGTPGITPTPATEWDFSTGFARVVPAQTKSNVAFASKAITDATATANRDTCIYQFVYPLPTGVAFLTSQTIKGRVLTLEGATASNLRSQAIIRVMGSDGTTVRATLYAGDLTTGTTNPTSEWGTTQANRQMPRGTTVAVAANYTSVAGDHLVIELGYRKHAAASTAGTIRLGTLSATADLPENETQTTDGDTWIEFSGSLDAPPVIVTTTISDLGLGSTTAAVQAAASIAATKSDLGLGSTSAIAGLGAAVAATKSDLGLGSTAAAVQAGARVISTKSDLALDSLSGIVQAGVRISSVLSDLGLGSSAAIVGIGALVPATVTDLALGSSVSVVHADVLVLGTSGAMILDGSSGTVGSGALVLAVVSDLALAGSVAAIDEPGGGVSETVVASPGDLGLGSTAGIIESGVLVITTAGTLDLTGSDGFADSSVLVLSTAGNLGLASTLAHVVSGDVVIVIVPIVSGVSERLDILRSVARKQYGVASESSARLIAE